MGSATRGRGFPLKMHGLRASDYDCAQAGGEKYKRNPQKRFLKTAALFVTDSAVLFLTPFRVNKSKNFCMCEINFTNTETNVILSVKTEDKR